MAGRCTLVPEGERWQTPGLKSPRPPPPARLGACIRLHVNDKLGVGIGEAGKLVLVQVHDEKFVGRREFHGLSGELLVEVGGVAPVPLPNGKQTR